MIGGFSQRAWRILLVGILTLSAIWFVTYYTSTLMGLVQIDIALGNHNAFGRWVVEHDIPKIPSLRGIHAGDSVLEISKDGKYIPIEKLMFSHTICTTSPCTIRLRSSDGHPKTLFIPYRVENIDPVGYITGVVVFLALVALNLFALSQKLVSRTLVPIIMTNFTLATQPCLTQLTGSRNELEVIIGAVTLVAIPSLLYHSTTAAQTLYGNKKHSIWPAYIPLLVFVLYELSVHTIGKGLFYDRETLTRITAAWLAGGFLFILLKIIVSQVVRILRKDACPERNINTMLGVTYGLAFLPALVFLIFPTMQSTGCQGTDNDYYVVLVFVVPIGILLHTLVKKKIIDTKTFLRRYWRCVGLVITTILLYAATYSALYPWIMTIPKQSTIIILVEAVAPVLLLPLLFHYWNSSAELRLDHELMQEERKKLSLEIHDNVIYPLGCLKVIDDTDQRNTAISGLIDDLRAICTSLHPISIESTNLTLAITEMVKGYVISIDGLRASLEITENDVLNSLPLNIRLTLYKAAEELLKNVIKHAQASNVVVRLRGRNYFVVLEVADNGIGFETREETVTSCLQCRHFGLAGILDRAQSVGGLVQIDSSRGKGTRIAVIIPFG